MTKHTFINKKEVPGYGNLLVYETKELVEKPEYTSRLQEILATDYETVKLLERILLHGGLLPDDSLTAVSNGYLWKRFEKHLHDEHEYDWEVLC